MSIKVTGLAGSRILLRPYEVDDAPALYQAVHDSRHELAQWLSWCNADYAMADSIQFLDARGSKLRNEEEFAMGMFERQTGRMVGGCGFNEIDKNALRANLGYWVRTDATRRGYATEAVRLLARWGFEQLGLERIEIVAAVGNLASQGVAIRAGATREGVARRRLRVHGVQHDAVVFSLLPGEVPASQD